MFATKLFAPKPFLTLTVLALGAFCSSAQAQSTSFALAPDSSVFSVASADASTSSRSSDDDKSVLTDVGIGLVGLSFFSLMHGGSSSGGAAAPALMANASPAAVPEASSVVSFSLLLTLGLGGLFVTTRKRRTN